MRNTRRNSGSLPPPAMAPTPGSGAPYNPFARTLATSEAAFGLQKPEQAQDGGGQAKQEGTSKGMDVDMFKNILMTGSPAPTPPHSQRTQASSSSTDTSSASRPSLFDPNFDLRPESPRSSFDSVRYSDDDEGAGDEKSGLMGANEERLDHFAPPAPPKPGQTRAPRGPQTVSFADFGKASAPDSAGSTTPGTSPVEKTTVNRAIPHMLHRQASDLNKPLPAPPPLSPGLPREQSSSIDTQTPQPPTPTVSSPEDPVKKPPPPPVSRRGGQGVSTPNRARSTSNTTQSSTQDHASPQAAPQNSTPKAPAPPPPPSRKSKPAVPAPPPAGITSMNDITSAAQSAVTPTEPEPRNMLPPQPPPRRNPSTKATPSMHRSPSSASHSSIARSEQYVNPAAPPAPPPRRAAGSKRQSLDGAGTPHGRAYDHRRSSQNSFESTRSTSLSKPSLPSESEEAVEVTSPAPATTAAGNNILDDMTAFQAEIDALRAQAGKGD